MEKPMGNDTQTLPRSNPLTGFVTGRGFVLVLRLFLGCLFIISSLHKIYHPDQFAVAVRAYQIIPINLSNLFALLVAWTEAMAGIMLLFGIMTRKAAAAVALLLVMFVVAITTTLVRGLTIDCGCFSSKGGHAADLTLIVQDLFLATAAVLVMRFDSGFFSLSNVFSRRG
jgi:putative oxidoreductase